ncbi:hypothetical protein LINGRAHAP2_LOCUS7916, partial [Linum grandiflorum]
HESGFYVKIQIRDPDFLKIQNPKKLGSIMNFMFFLVYFAMFFVFFVVSRFWIVSL